MSSASHGRRPAWMSRMTAASIISRSASGSAILPKRASTCELRANGFTAVGEFHYLGLDEARAAAEAASEAGIELTLLYACYLRGGIPRFRQESVADYLRQLEVLRADGIRVGVAPHSVRACPP